MKKARWLILPAVVILLAVFLAANRKVFANPCLMDSTEITASPEEIRDFFVHLDDDHIAWHPAEHVVFQWTGGRPMALGPTFYAEEYAMGEIKKYSGTVTEVVEYQKVGFALSGPVSLLTPFFEWRIQSDGAASVFTAVTPVRAGKLLEFLMPQAMKDIYESGRWHMQEEGRNLKAFMEESGK
ncbi:MAG: SRPBCC family protein [Anaerolineales bacterium]